MNGYKNAQGRNTRQPNVFYPSPFASDRPTEDPQTTKALRIKEYLGISANISDQEFEAFQNDIQYLTETVGIETNDYSQANKYPLDPLQYSQNVYRANLLAAAASRPRPPPPTGSDTEDSSGEEFNPYSVFSHPSDIAPDEEFDLISHYEMCWFQVSWRWSWLQLNTKEVQHSIQLCDDKLTNIRNQKTSLLPLDEQSTNSISDSDTTNMMLDIPADDSTASLAKKEPETTNSEADPSSTQISKEDSSSAKLAVDETECPIAQRSLPISPKPKSKIITPGWKTLRLQLESTPHPLWRSDPKKIKFSPLAPLFEQRPDTLPPPPTPPAVPAPEKAKPESRKKKSSKHSSSKSSDKSRSSLKRKKKRHSSSSSHSSTHSSRHRHKIASSNPLRKSSDFDINNVVLPSMGAVRRVRKIQYKEIFTPTFRIVNDRIPSDESSGDELTDDEFFSKLHNEKEREEHIRFAPPSKKKRQQKKKLSSSAGEMNINSPLSPESQKIALSCSTSGVNTSNSGYYPDTFYVSSGRSLKKHKSYDGDDDENGMIDNYEDVSTEEEDNEDISMKEAYPQDRFGDEGESRHFAPSSPDTEPGSPDTDLTDQSSPMTDPGSPPPLSEDSVLPIFTDEVLLGKRARWVAFKVPETANSIRITKSPL